MWLVFVAAVAMFVLSLLKTKRCISRIQLPLEEWMPKTRPFFLLRATSLLLHIASLFFLSWAFIHFAVGSGPFEKFIRPSPSVALPPSIANSRVLLFVIDRSGSMAEPLPGNPSLSKITAVKDGLTSCIATIDQAGGETDLIGLLTFARAARIEVPLSRDRQFLEAMISKIVPETVERLNGTAIGYAIFKSVSLIVACRSFATEEEAGGAGIPVIGNSIVLITDGLEEPNPADRGHPFRSIRTLQALDYAKENNVKVNYVNVDKNSYQQLSAEERDRLLRAVEETGGRYFEVTYSQSLGQVMAQIALSVQGQKVPQVPENSLAIGFWLIVVALTLSSLSRLLETVVVRVVR